MEKELPTIEETATMIREMVRQVTEHYGAPPRYLYFPAGEVGSLPDMGQFGPTPMPDWRIPSMQVYATNDLLFED